MAELSNRRYEAFCVEYIKDKVGAAAARRAGYAPSNAAKQAKDLLRKPEVKARIDELLAEVAEGAKLTAEGLIERYRQIAYANPNEITQLRRSACRYCYGYDHHYQWRTTREFTAALSAWLKKNKNTDEESLTDPKPTDGGGYGYTRHALPNPDCPECDGLGAVHVHFNDTRRLSPDATALFAGVKETQHGIEVKMKDQMAALDSLARHFNLFEKDNTRKVELQDELLQVINDINAKGSRAPIATAQQGEDRS